MSLSPEQNQEIAAQVDFEPEVFSIIDSESPTFLRKLELIQYWYEREAAQLEQDFPATVQIQRNVELEGTGNSRFIKLQLDGIFFEVDTPDAIAVVFRLRSKLPKGYMPITLDFQRREELLKEDFEEALGNSAERSLIGVVKLDDHFQIVQFFGTAAGNYELSNADIIDKLRAWEKLCDFEIMGGGGDTLELAFKTLPENRLAFAEDVYDFCPDLMDQGYVGPPLGEGATMEDYAEAMDEQTVEDLVDYLERNMAVGFWWD
ncbi:DUF4253 domain-containing protein [Acaryochloris sp. IP29b_bin.137]|uniref:DUF4253 domain-containing protein n=1 Tax=Acaryochloris sp. IP29b_bin.137 TaxID=2969217 RepID=UPI002612B8D1|nr:DUF4253 domain-containing protein [Acaryochloris sp. IP29b_bin.137]